MNIYSNGINNKKQNAPFVSKHGSFSKLHKVGSLKFSVGRLTSNLSKVLKSNELITNIGSLLPPEDESQSSLLICY